MEEKTINAYAVNGENGCFVYTGNETCIVDFEVFNPLNHSVKRYKYTVTNVTNRTNAIAFIQFLCCGYANFIDAFDININKKLYQRSRDMSEKIY